MINSSWTGVCESCSLQEGGQNKRRIDERVSNVIKISRETEFVRIRRKLYYCVSSRGRRTFLILPFVPLVHVEINLIKREISHNQTRRCTLSFFISTLFLEEVKSALKLGIFLEIEREAEIEGSRGRGILQTQNASIPTVKYRWQMALSKILLVLLAILPRSGRNVANKPRVKREELLTLSVPILPRLLPSTPST